MLADPFIAYRDVTSGAAVTDSYARISLSGNNSVYTKTTYTPNSGFPKTIRISHNTVGKGAGLRDRRMVRIEAPCIVDSVEDSRVAAVYLVADLPRGLVSDAQRDALFTHIVGLLRMGSGNVAYDAVPSAFWQKFWRGEA